MKRALLLLAFISSIYTVQAQSTFKVDAIQRPHAEAIYDVAFFDNQYYCLSVNTAVTTPFEKTSTLFIFNDDGSLDQEYALGETGHQYFQIRAIETDHIQLIGSITEHPCSHVVLSDFNLASQALSPITQYSFCDTQIINKLRLIPGLDNTRFVQGDYGPYPWHNTGFVLQLDDQAGFTLVFDSIAQYYHFTIDFSKKGYALKSTYECDFYDRNWNFRKARNNFLDGYDDAIITSHLPFGNKQILDQVIKEPYAQALRMVDSNLYIRNEVVIVPPGNGYSQINYLPINGISAIDDHHVWVATNYGEYAESDFSFYGITRVDDELNILCSEFVGFDANYQLKGVRTHPDGSAIVFGQRLPFNEEAVSPGADIFVAKYDPDCGLSTSTTDPNRNAVSFTLNPNPAEDAIRLISNDVDLATLQVQIIDAWGRVVLANQNAAKEIDISRLAAGQYFYYVSDENRLISSGSWVKQ